jgi:sterol desaturase/sphingolipid hydroxylase (fatty acid hydroxylase superfamily)
MLVFIGGVLTYTLVEYAMHRFVYHSGEDYKNEGSWQYKVHGVHHALPQEKELIALPIPLAVMIALLFYMIFSLLLGRQVYFFFSGFLAGYATYLYVHFLVHTRRPPKNVFKYLWRHHLIHHYSDDDKAFGVSSPLWDIIFGTMPQDASVYRNKRFSKDH